MPVIDGSDGDHVPDMPDYEDYKEDHMDTNDDTGYPTEWHLYNSLLSVEVRQLTADTYQLRSPSHVCTLNKEGFNLYRDNTPQGAIIFEDWCERNGVVSVPRELEADDGKS